LKGEKAFFRQEDSIEDIPLEKCTYKDLGLIATPQLKEFPVHTISSALGKNNMIFLPENYQDILGRISRMKKAIKIASLVLIFAIAFSVVFAVRFAKKNHQVVSLESYLRDVEKEAASIKVLHRRILAAKNVQTNQLASLETFSAVIPLLKKNMRLSSFGIDKNNKVKISGHASSYKNVLEFRGKLQQQPVFSNVNSEYIQKKKFRGKDVFTFKITFHYVPVSP